MVEQIDSDSDVIIVMDVDDQYPHKSNPFTSNILAPTDVAYPVSITHPIAQQHQRHETQRPRSVVSDPDVIEIMDSDTSDSSSSLLSSFTDENLLRRQLTPIQKDNMRKTNIARMFCNTPPEVMSTSRQSNTTANSSTTSNSDSGDNFSSYGEEDETEGVNHDDDDDDDDDDDADDDDDDDDDDDNSINSFDATSFNIDCEHAMVSEPDSTIERYGDIKRPLPGFKRDNLIMLAMMLSENLYDRYGRKLNYKDNPAETTHLVRMCCAAGTEKFVSMHWIRKRYQWSESTSMFLRNPTLTKMSRRVALIARFAPKKMSRFLQKQWTILEKLMDNEYEPTYAQSMLYDEHLGICEDRIRRHSLTLRYLYELPLESLRCMANLVLLGNIPKFYWENSEAIAEAATILNPRSRFVFTPYNITTDPMLIWDRENAVSYCVRYTKHTFWGNEENISKACPVEELRPLRKVFPDQQYDVKWDRVFCGVASELMGLHTKRVKRHLWNRAARANLHFTDVITPSMLAHNQHQSNNLIHPPNESPPEKLGTIPLWNDIFCYPLPGPFSPDDIWSLLRHKPQTSRVLIIACDGESIDAWDFHALIFLTHQTEDYEDKDGGRAKGVHYTCTLLSPEQNNCETKPLTDEIGTTQIIESWRNSLESAYGDIPSRMTLFYYNMDTCVGQKASA